MYRNVFSCRGLMSLSYRPFTFAVYPIIINFGQTNVR